MILSTTLSTKMSDILTVLAGSAILCICIWLCKTVFVWYWSILHGSVTHLKPWISWIMTLLDSLPHSSCLTHNRRGRPASLVIRSKIQFHHCSLDLMGLEIFRALHSYTQLIWQSLSKMSSKTHILQMLISWGVWIISSYLLLLGGVAVRQCLDWTITDWIPLVTICHVNVFLRNTKPSLCVPHSEAFFRRRAS